MLVIWIVCGESRRAAGDDVYLRGRRVQQAASSFQAKVNWVAKYLKIEGSFIRRHILDWSFV